MTERSTDGRSLALAATLRALGVALLVAVPVVLVLARPIPFHLIVRDDRGRPVEAVVVRVGRAADPHQVVELYTNEAGEVSAEIAGVGKSLDLAINPATAASSVPSGNGAYDVGAGPTYDTERLHGVAPDRYTRASLELTLHPRLSTRQVCRLTGYGSASRPYQYAGQDSAITIPYVHEVNGRSVERLLWWFGDTVGESDGPILVSNKMATSDPAADASHCIDLEYVGGRDQGPLVVDPGVASEATVWLDIPLVSSRVSESRPHGGYAFQPYRGDHLSVGYLSVADTKPLFTVTHLGLATATVCDDVDCGVAGEGRGIRLERNPDAVWNAPLEYTRAPEGSAFLFGDTYTILKVAERRPYCAAPPHAVDCSAKQPCPDGGECVEPGKFCDEAPTISCRGDRECEHGRCTPGGVIAMQVERSQVTVKSAYRYWDARSRRFEPASVREPDAILVDSRLGNSVSVMWSEYAERWIMISNHEAALYSGQRLVAMRSADDLLGPWGEPETIMENLGGQRSYNPRFVPAYTHAPRANFVYWTATYDAYDASWPMHGRPFDYNVFLYETDLAAVGQRVLSKRATSVGSTSSVASRSVQENRGTSSAGVTPSGRSSSPSENAR